MTGEFIKVKCNDCGNNQIIFNRAATPVVCQICGAPLATPSGGLAEIRGEIISKCR